MKTPYSCALLRLFVVVIAISLILSGCRKPSKDLQSYSDTPSIALKEKDTVNSSKEVSETESTEPAENKNSKSTAAKPTVESTTVTSTEQPPVKAKINYSYSNMKCIWLSQYDCNDIYCKNGKQRSVGEYKSLLSVMLNNIQNCGFNTVFVQMRPNADSIYPSDFYPPSIFAVGQYGKAFSYDPVSILIEEAHNRNLSVHAWINPLRAVNDEQMQMIPDNFALKQWYNDANLKGKYIVFVGNKWYLNPAYPDVRGLIINGVREMLGKYSFDGLHMDDYFYPTTDEFFDKAAYIDYQNGGGTLSLADFRRSSLNTLVKQMYDTVKSVDSKLPYGISPAGEIDRVYETLYADVYLWCSQHGYVDYICPQVYFGFEHQTSDFKKICNAWSNMISDASGVALIIGMTLGKALSGTDPYAGTGKNEWSEHKDILKRCIEFTASLPRCIGVSYFCYQYFYDPVSGETVGSTQSERDTFLPVLKAISWQ